jgi:hypothetical protein
MKELNWREEELMKLEKKARKKQRRNRNTRRQMKDATYWEVNEEGQTVVGRIS